MSEVTAEMIERGRGGDPRLAAERRRLAMKVREAREKLTSSGSGHRTFDVELLRLYAERRKAAAAGLLALSLAISSVALQWGSTKAILIWIVLNAAAIGFGYAMASVFLRKPPAEVHVTYWERLFVAVETIQGIAWALIICIAFDLAEPKVAAFVLIALLLVAAMNSTVTASIPAAVYGGLMPMTVAIVALLRPTSFVDSNALLAELAFGTQIYFAFMARKLYASAIQTLSFQAEKDELIAELEQSQTNSDLARRRAEESNLAKSRFLATMSHELRTPLNAILGFSEVMKAELFGKHDVPAYKEYSGDIHSSGEHLLMLINEILDLSRVEAGRYDLREESVDMQGVIDECRHLMTLRARKKDIIIQQTGAGELPRLWADERAVRQVALNLLSNAIKFTPQGGSVAITTGWTADGGQFFAIKDTGQGIPENEIPIVMSSFGRGSLAQKTAEEGTGLGLPIVKGLVELHGGTFTLKSTVRVGTEVTVTFPPERVMDALPPLTVELGERARPPKEARAPLRTAA
ncbi:HAMP domain-containing sensor histidine kinase [Beijerinckia sp. L45]|uniref:sensor histidine kinase n=1 Tax=Beijerinckia sp. L45 TaxID=1641855 RepID=UPI00131B6042|nr:ATP-binding protein [Beijerinckia sp. L45]